MATSTLTIRVDDDLKRAPSEVADYYGLDLSLVTRAFYKQMVNTRRIPLTFAPEEPNSESLAAIREGDAFLASGDEARFDNGASLVAAAMCRRRESRPIQMLATTALRRLASSFNGVEGHSG